MLNITLTGGEIKNPKTPTPGIWPKSLVEGKSMEFLDWLGRVEICIKIVQNVVKGTNGYVSHDVLTPEEIATLREISMDIYDSGAFQKIIPPATFAKACELLSKEI